MTNETVGPEAEEGMEPQPALDVDEGLLDEPADTDESEPDVDGEDDDDPDDTAKPKEADHG